MEETTSNLFIQETKMLDDVVFTKKEPKEFLPKMTLESVGDSFIGRFVEVNEIMTNNKFGPGKKPTKLYEFSDPTTGENFVYWGTGGFNGKMKYNQIKPDDLIRVTKKEKTTYNNLPCNDYEILVAQ